MNDLLKLLSDRQDAPRYWEDDLSDWNAGQCFEDFVFGALLCVGFALACLPLVLVGFMVLLGLVA